MPTNPITGVKFRWNPAFFRELANQREVGDALLTRGDEIVQGARSGLHFKAPTGAYESSLSATKEQSNRGWAAYANAEVDHAWFVEFGVPEHVPEYAPLRTAAEMLGRLRSR